MHKLHNGNLFMTWTTPPVAINKWKEVGFSVIKETTVSFMVQTDVKEKKKQSWAETNQLLAVIAI